MKSGLTAKLFVAFLATNIVIALAMVIAVRLSVDAGFRSYVLEREGRRLDSLARSLADAYAEHGNWDFLRGNDPLWAQLNRSLFPDHGRDSPRRSGAPPPHPNPEDFPFRPPGAPPEEEGERGSFVPPALLLDLQQQPVAGIAPRIADGVERAVMVDGKEVGRLLGTAGPPTFEAADLRFLEGQLRTFWIVGMIAILVAAMVALALARGLLAPVKRLAIATHTLASGNYTVRVAPTTRDELGQLVQDFNRLAQALEDTDQRRRDFLADISHELRTPVAVLQGELEALEDGIRPLSQDAVRSLRAETTSLNVLIGDLYDLSLADAGGLAYRAETYDFGEAVAAALDAFRERLAARGLALEFTQPEAGTLLVHGDPDRLRQLLFNLFENSVRYTDANGHVRVSLQRVGSELRLDVEDSAPGVPTAMLSRIFERLFRVESSRNRASGGAGLGLALCRSIVAAHGGTIEARASALGGLAIRVILPRATV